MKKIAVVTDSNSGITQKQAGELGVHVLPMPFLLDGVSYFEDINFTQEEFYARLMEDSDISTSQPAVGSVMELWDRLLKEHDELVHIPMSRGLSASCESATLLARDYGSRVQVVDNQRISVTQRQSVLDALELAKAGWDAARIREYLESVKLDSSIYIMMNTLKYLKRGGRITPAAAAIGTLLRIKPVLQIQGEKLDSFAKARSAKQARRIMIEAVKHDLATRFSAFADAAHTELQIAYSYDAEAARDFEREVAEAFPGYSINTDPLSLSVACHIGPGALAMACAKKLDVL